jgi:transcriptional regulator with XRE-family HTH domain
MPPLPAPAAVADHPLRRVRRRRGLTLAVLADLSGLSVAFLSMVENGQRALTRRGHVNALAAALRVAPAEIAPSTLPGSGEWGSPPPATARVFPVTGDEITAARHRDLAAELTSYVIRGDRYAAGVWLRRLARDPAVSPWLLLDQLITRETGVSGPRPRGGSGTRLVSADGTGRGRAG